MRKLIMPLLLLLLMGGSDSAVDTWYAGTTSFILDVIFIEHSPNFTDLYMVKSLSKNRRVVIYCNTSYCYKKRSLAESV